MDSLPSGICYRHWPVDNAKACVLLAHGLAEHTGRYAHVAARFNERGVAVVGPDHVGHGASPGIRVFLRTFSEYLEPMLALRGLIEEWYPGQPVFLFGHSMGGLISAHLLLESQGGVSGSDAVRAGFPRGRSSAGTFTLDRQVAQKGFTQAGDGVSRCEWGEP